MTFARILAALALLLLPAAQPLFASGVPNGGLRLATYNTYLLSPMFKCPITEGPVSLDCLRQVEGDTERWANSLADTIIARYHDLDVIALNEVWDEDARKILADRLRDRYPIQVRKIDAPLLTIRGEVFTEGANAEGEVDVKGEDSGLMLFAKDDFAVDPLPVAQYRWRNDANGTLEASTKQVAFVLYEACTGDDCLAAKGAALIRLRHKGDGQVHNIVFTHMQADYDDGASHDDTRLKQLQDIRDMIRTTVPGLESRLADARETLFVVGDLNVPFLKTREEWDNRFGSGWFATAMYESMAFSGSPDDKTPTNQFDEERLDYILSSPKPFVAPAKHTCTQHVTVPVAFRDLESDHYMVHADIQRGSYHCSPSAAYRLTVPASGQLQDVDQSPGNSALDVTAISAPGAMQWVLVESSAGGTFSIGTDQNAIVADVYLPEDLTTPVARYNETKAPVPACIRHCYAQDKYVLPQKFYIRVRGATRNTTGDYALGVRRHTCRSKEDACLLGIGPPSGAKLSPENVVQGTTPQNEAWFRFDVTGTATSGDAQTIELTAKDIDGQRVRVELRDLELAAGSGATQQTRAGNTQTYKVRATQGSKGYLRIWQTAPRPGSASTDITATYDSNLRYLRIGQLICRDETDPHSGSDDIFTRLRIDGKNRRVPSSDYVEFNCDAHNDPADWGRYFPNDEVRYLDGVSIRIIEDDDASANDEANRVSIPALGAGKLEREDAHLEWAFDGGRYWLMYDLYRRRPGTVAD